MDPRFLRSFLSIAETGSLSRAATALNIVQPALSRQVRILEEELGVQLLVRHRRGVVLTEAGQLLRERATAIISAIEETRQAITEAGGEPSGNVHLGVPTSMIQVLSADVVADFAKRYRRVSLHVVEAFVNVIEEGLRDGRLDVAILISPKPMTGIALEPLLTEDICLVGPRAGKLRLTEKVPLETVAAVPMIMFPTGNKVRSTVEELLAKEGRKLNAVMEVDGQALMSELVRRGTGYTMLPYCGVREATAAGSLSAAPIEGASLTWELGVNRARAGAPAVTALVQMLQAAIDEQKTRGVWRRTEPAGGRPARRGGVKAAPRARKARDGGASD